MTTSYAPIPLIPIVALGVYRSVAANMDPLLTSTPFRMTAILDLASQPAAFRYTPHNLGVILHNLHPRPKVFITGAAISGGMTAEAITVWESYVRETKQQDSLVINLCNEPPPGGDWMSHIMRKLEEKYSK